MKHYVLIFFIFLFGSMAFATPATQQGLKNSDPAVYLHDIKLFKQLEDDYRKRCWVETPTSFNNICGEGSYQEQVLGTYFRNKLGN